MSGEPRGGNVPRAFSRTAPTAAKGAGSAARPWTSTPVVFVQRIDDIFLHWSVVEVDAANTPGARGSHCLLFTREGCVRRVWNYPPHWQSLNDVELAALSWNR